MDEFRRQLQELAERVRDWVSDLGVRLGGKARSAGRSVEERRSRQGADDSPRYESRSGAGGRRPTATSRDLGGDAAVVVATGEDDVASVVGRIDVADSPEVILIVRRDARALRRPSAWPHVAAHVRRRGIELGVVSPRGDVRAHARANGLRVSRTPGGLRPQVEYIDVFGRRIEVPPVPWGRVVKGAMMLIALSTITFMACYRVPSATITIVPDSEPITASGSARANALVGAGDLTTQTIVATTVRRQVFTAVTTTTTGEVEIGDERALLDVTFANASGAVVLVPRGTRVISDEGIVFLTDEDLDVPAEDSATVGATAEFPGEPGNVDANTLVEIEGDVPDAVTIESSSGGSGGTNVLTAGVSQADVERVREIAGDILDGIALRTLEALVEEEGLGTLLPQSVSAAIFSEQPLQRLDEPAEIFVVEYTITASGLVVTEASAIEYGELLIRDALPEGVALVPGSVTATAEPSGERASVEVVATGRTAVLSSIADAANQVVGMRPEAARNLLQQELGLEVPPTIEISPNFVPWLWLPRRAASIEVVIGGPESDEASEEDAADEGGDDGADASATPTVTPTETAAPGG